jgi:serine/threonine protein kinase
MILPHCKLCGVTCGFIGKNTCVGCGHGFCNSCTVEWKTAAPQILKAAGQKPVSSKRCCLSCQERINRDETFPNLIDRSSEDIHDDINFLPEKLQLEGFDCGKHIKSKTKVAIKCIKRIHNSPNDQAAVFRETYLLRKLRNVSSNIIFYHHFYGETKKLKSSYYYQVYELIPNAMTLYHYMHQLSDSWPKEDDFRLLMKAVFDATKHIHLRGIVHRNLTPHSIVLSINPDGAVEWANPKLIGFEYSTFAVENDQTIATFKADKVKRFVVGKDFKIPSDYIAPELIRKEKYGKFTTHLTCFVESDSHLLSTTLTCRLWSRYLDTGSHAIHVAIRY